MRLYTEVRLWLGALVVLTLVVALAGISLLGRTAPAVRHILDENVPSLQAGEVMLATLASHPGAVDVAGRARYHSALDRARRNVTHHDEDAPLTALARLAPSSLAGPGQARRESVALLERVMAINRAEMERKDRAAQRLANAGSWALVVLGILSVLLGLFSVRRMMHRLVRPMRELHACLAASRAGDVHRRAHLVEAPAGLMEMAQNLNAVLDRQPLPPAG